MDSPRRGRSPLTVANARLAIALSLAALALGCTPEALESEAAVFLNIDTIVLESDPWGDVLTQGGTILDDTASVTLSAYLKAPIATNPTIVAPELNNVNLERYEVTYQRLDGGTQVPPGFQSGISGTVRLSELGEEEVNQLTLDLVIVPSTIKAQPPISYLVSPGQEPATNFTNIQVNARIQFFGTTVSGDQVTVIGNIGVNFANYGDENS